MVADIRNKQGMKNMLPKLLVVLLIIYFSGLSAVTASGDDSPATSEEAPYFSNKDIEKYKKPSDDKTPDVKIDKTERKGEAAREKKIQQEQEYWCKKATQYNRKVEVAQDEVKGTEKELSDLKDALSQGTLRKKKSVERNIKSNQKKLDGAKNRLKYAERDLGDLEDEAHRKDIPPGWLRCQFE